MERLTDLVSQHHRERWPESKINFGGRYPELTPAERAADPKLALRIEAGQEIEGQRNRWLHALGSTLNDAYRYLLDGGYIEAFQAFQHYPVWLFMQQRPQDRDAKVVLDYLEKPISKDIESMKALIAATGRRTRPGSTSRKTKTESHLTVRSVLLQIAREARNQKQATAATDIGIPQSHLSRLEHGKRPWTTTNLGQCASYVCDSPQDGIIKAFIKLAAREFRSS